MHTYIEKYLRWFVMKTAHAPLSSKALYTIAFVSLLGGVGFYYFFRAPVAAYGWFGLEGMRLFGSDSAVLGALPEFVHVFSFSLLTFLILDRSYPLWSTLFWVAINLIAELAQLLPKASVENLPQILQRYIVNGTFSIADIAAILWGGILAYILMTYKGSEK